MREKAISWKVETDILWKQPLWLLLNCNTVDEKYNLLHEKLSLVIDKYAPMKEVKPNNDYDLKPWINEKIISKIKAKHIYSYKYSKSRDPKHKKTIRILRNQINHEIRRSKYLYFKNFFENNKGNIKRHWNAVNLRIRFHLTFRL